MAIYYQILTGVAASGIALKFSKWWRDRRLRTLEDQQRLESAEAMYLRERMEAMQRELTERIDELEAENKRQERELEAYHEYALYALKRNRQLEEWAAANGIELPPPDFQAFSTWREDETKD